jgi:hypothetical protein
MSQRAFPLAVDVECYAGYRGEETPQRFRLAEREIEIVDVVDRWLAPDHRYFKVQDTQGDLLILRNDVAARRWEITLFRRGTSSDQPQSRRRVLTVFSEHCGVTH